MTERRRPRTSAGRLLAGLAAVVFVAAGLVAGGSLAAAPASALSGSQFNAGNIISDATFFNSGTLSADQVQSFLNDHGSNCSGTASLPCLKNYSQATASRAGTNYCSAYSGQSSETAAQIIVRVGQACGINPQVLLVMLQKEQGLVDASSTTSYMYRSALGYGCPDTAACDSTYYGFFNQVYSAAAQFQSYTKNSSSWSYQPGRNNNILYNPDYSCGSGSVYIQNQATANLYIYTPYQPNAAALANLTGSGDGCSAYGNRNFWVYFNSWFGDPTGGGLQSPSFEGGSTGWVAGNGFVNHVAYNDPSGAQNGSWYYASNTQVAGRSIAQDVPRTVAVGDLVTSTIWLRSATGSPFSGTLALWGLGGQTESAGTPFTVGSSWQQVTVQLPVRLSSHSTVRLETYMDTTSGTLYMDNATMAFGTATPDKNLLSAPSFEGTLSNWTQGNGFVNRTIYQDPAGAHSGSWYGATNTDTPGRSLSQTVSATPAAGSRYTFSIWVRSAIPSQPFTGTVALWALGSGAPVANSAAFTASGSWTRIAVTTDISQANVSQVKAEIYLTSTNNTLYIDDAQVGPNLMTAGSFEGGSFTGWGAGQGFINTAVYSTAATGIAAQNGSYFAATNTNTPGNSLSQVVPRQTYVGETYTAEVWLRSANDGQTFSGTLALWGLGGVTEQRSTNFTVGTTWTRVAVDLPVAAMGHTSLKFEVYENTTGNNLWVDSAQIN
ncbi:hypothetical protein [Subtercola sp. RTI3]|uniref:hypothetical protein n=1 Tax=Subtercola sp. RTI3 TaxID=3048639 RepID=UPI002B22B353|nr:hypothetical protein [Subtercola sp. RTI3]MEA9984424.1 carbohydrate binding domain-containing protein [Subtercola sp. RTI3]